MKRGPGRVGSPLGALGLVRAVRPRHVTPDPQFRFLRQHLPRNPAAQHEEDAGETGAIRDAGPPTIRSRRWNGQKRFDEA